MIIQIPVTNDPAQDFVMQLGTSKWEFYVRYNDRGNFWTMDITDYNSQTLLVAGMPLVLGTDLLSPYILENGSLIAYDTTGSSTDAGPDDLGQRVMLYWFSPDQVAALLPETQTT